MSTGTRVTLLDNGWVAHQTESGWCAHGGNSLVRLRFPTFSEAAAHARKCSGATGE